MAMANQQAYDYGDQRPDHGSRRLPNPYQNQPGDPHSHPVGTFGDGFGGPSPYKVAKESMLARGKFRSPYPADKTPLCFSEGRGSKPATASNDEIPRRQEAVWRPFTSDAQTGLTATRYRNWVFEQSFLGPYLWSLTGRWVSLRENHTSQLTNVMLITLTKKSRDRSRTGMWGTGTRTQVGGIVQNHSVYPSGTDTRKGTVAGYYRSR